MSIEELIHEGGKEKWIDFSKLSPEGKSLTEFEPDEILSFKNTKFKIIRIQLEPALMVIVPVG